VKKINIAIFLTGAYTLLTVLNGVLTQGPVVYASSVQTYFASLYFKVQWFVNHPISLVTLENALYVGIALILTGVFILSKSPAKPKRRAPSTFRGKEEKVATKGLRFLAKRRQALRRAN